MRLVRYKIKYKINQIFYQQCKWPSERLKDEINRIDNEYAKRIENY
jgi:hypothetical protein